MGSASSALLNIFFVLVGQSQALPPEYRTEFDGIQGTFEFTNPTAVIRRQECWRRPVLFYAFAPQAGVGRGGLADFGEFAKGYAKGPLCVLAVSTRTISADEIASLERLAPGVPIFASESQLNREFLSAMLGKAPKLPSVRLLNRIGAAIYRKSGPSWATPQLRQLIESETQAVVRELPLGWVERQPEPSLGVRERIAVFERVGTALSRRDFAAAEAVGEEANRPDSRYQYSSSSKLADFFEAARTALPGETGGAFERRMRDYSDAYPKSALARLVFLRAMLISGDEKRDRGDVDGSLRAYREALAILDDKALDLGRSPQAYVLKTQLMLRLHWDLDSVFEVVKEGVRRHPDYLQIQTGLALHLSTLDTKPGVGWADYAANPLKRPRGQSADETYAYIVSSVCAEAWWLGPNCIGAAERNALDWGRLRRGMSKIIERWPHFTEGRDSLAWYACVFGDRETAEKQFSVIGSGFSTVVWGNEAAYLFWRRWAAGRDKD